jgi:hypothetical protein
VLWIGRLDPDPKGKETSCFEVLDVFFYVLKASPVDLDVLRGGPGINKEQFLILKY